MEKMSVHYFSQMLKDAGVNPETVCNLWAEYERATTVEAYEWFIRGLLLYGCANGVTANIVKCKDCNSEFALPHFGKLSRTCPVCTAAKKA